MDLGIGLVGHSLTIGVSSTHGYPHIGCQVDVARAMGLVKVPKSPKIDVILPFYSTHARREAIVAKLEPPCLWQGGASQAARGDSRMLPARHWPSLPSPVGPHMTVLP